MRNRSILFCAILFFSTSPLLAFDIKGMFEGMGTTFGAPPVGYTYSYEVWSDAIVPIYVEQQGIASFMGAYFPSAKGYYGKKMLPSIFDAGGAVSQGIFHNQAYYFKMYVSANSDAYKDAIYRQSLTQLPLVKNDPKIYYYHVFTSGGFSKGNAVHGPAIEQMGYRDPSQENNTDTSKQGTVKFSSQLSALTFYNSSGTDVQVSLTYGKNPYAFTVEKYSYSSLAIPTPQEKEPSKTSLAGTVSVTGSDTASKKSDTPLAPLFSLRPNTLSFSAYNASTKKYDAPFRSLSLPSQGFDGFTYTIEIFQDPGKNLEVCVQGLTPGNYDLAVTSRVRDVTPCPCTFWYQSFEQGGSVEGYSDLPGQVWVIYGGADNPVQGQVVPGEVVTWNLTRPLLSQSDQLVYFVYVVTTDNTVAANFVKKVAAQMIGKNVSDKFIQTAQAPMPVSLSSTMTGLDVTGDAGVVTPTITSDQEVATLMGSLNIADGVIEDADQGVIGYIMGTDVFTPRGLGFGRFYYVLAPSVISVANIVSAVVGYLDSSKASALGGSDKDVQKSITATVNDWLAAYIKKSGDVQPKVEQFLLQYGNSRIVDAKTKKLTQFGQSRVQSIMSGKVSLKYPSMKLSTVTNQYVYDFGKAAPEKMPEGVMPLVGATDQTSATSSKSIVAKKVSTVAKPKA